MKTREELIKQQELLLKIYEKVKDKLMGYPNVVNVGIGVKEKDGKLTDEGCIKIIVMEKKPESDLAPNEIIPKEVEGVKTDVIIHKERIPIATCAEDQGNYRPIKGGIMINNYRTSPGSGGSGSLGCMAQLISDDSWVILSCHHVLYGTKGKDGDAIGQSWVGCSWCCKTNVIAENFDKDVALDCAIAKVKEDIAVENSILEIGNIELRGSASAVNGEQVRKRGARTGFTSGTISFIDPASKIITIDPNPNGGPAGNPGGCTNYKAGVNVFAYHGDSGSVIVNDDKEIIGLLYSVSHDYTQAFANDIGRVKTALKININATDLAPGRTPISSMTSGIMPDSIQPINNDNWIETIEQRLEETHAGQMIKKIINTHQDEVFKLVNKHRPVTVTWQRKQGPAFLAAFGRSVKNPEYRIPAEINRVSIQNLLMSMASVLEEHGSEQLRDDIRQYALDVIRASKQCSTAEEFLKVIEQLDDEAIIQTLMITN